jgi:hypothetical protein
VREIPFSLAKVTSTLSHFEDEFHRLPIGRLLLHVDDIVFVVCGRDVYKSFFIFCFSFLDRIKSLFLCLSLVVPSFPSPPGLVAEDVEKKWWEGLKRRERERGGMDFGYKINWSFHPHLNTPRPPRKKGRKEEEKKNPDFLASSLYCAASSSLFRGARSISFWQRLASCAEPTRRL